MAEAAGPVEAGRVDCPCSRRLAYVTSSQPDRSEDQLNPADRQRLEDAHARLRAAIAAYEEFLGGRLAPGEEVPTQEGNRVAQAQAEVEEAEQELWELREQLLGWKRPAWAPRATLVADWFSEEDAAYDDLSAAPGR